MLYQQGLTELIHSSPSEQVAYLLVERDSLLETSDIPGNVTGDGNTASLLGTEVKALNTTVHQVRENTSWIEIFVSILQFAAFSPLLDREQ